MFQIHRQRRWVLPMLAALLAAGAGASYGYRQARDVADPPPEACDVSYQTDEEATTSVDQEPGSDEYRDLTPEEERVIVHKGTEMPFTGVRRSLRGGHLHLQTLWGHALPLGGQVPSRLRLARLR